VEENFQGIQAADRMDQSVGNRRVGLLLRERAEEPVPDDENSAVVAVHVFRIRCVMHPVMGRGIEYPLEWTEAANEVGVQPELIKQIHGEHAADRQRIESEPVQRQVEKPSAGEQLRGAESKGARQVNVLGCVMHHVRGPQPADFMTGAMHPVVRELGTQKQEQQAPRAIERDRGHPMGPEEIPYRRNNQRPQQPYRHTQYPDDNAREHLQERIGPVLDDPKIEYFQQDGPRDKGVNEMIKVVVDVHRYSPAFGLVEAGLAE